MFEVALGIEAGPRIHGRIRSRLCIEPLAHAAHHEVGDPKADAAALEIGVVEIVTRRIDGKRHRPALDFVVSVNLDGTTPSLGDHTAIGALGLGHL